MQIGDRTFGKKTVHAYAYDLAHYWKEYTGLPFTFAVWIRVNSLPEGFIEVFNEALNYGLENRDLVIHDIPERTDFDIGKYLTENIDYRFDLRKREALDRYLTWLGAAERIIQTD